MWAKLKSCVFAVVVSVGLLLGLGVMTAFYVADEDAVHKVLEHVFGLKNNEAEFDIPQRDRQQFDQQQSLPEEAHDGWFKAKNIPFHSAVLIAGSQGYRNYRHQADVCHAYQVLRQGGLPSNQIITFVFDDIAHHYRNPYPGQIFNEPGGKDVYAGCAKDYTGWDVNKFNVVAVLRGDSRTMASKGSGRVLPVNPLQKVFLFYSDHGSVGSIAMPVGPPIYADELNSIIKAMADSNHFDEMLIYLESCDAGSMFRGFDLGPKVMAATAADAFESSYATYCPDQSHYTTRYDEPNATYIGACMGDLFSVSWMEDTDNVNRSEVLVQEQLSRVRFRTSIYDLYIYGSHVMIYGDRHGYITREVIGNYLSYFVAPPSWRKSDLAVLYNNAKLDEGHHASDVRYEQRQADLVPLYHLALQNDEAAMKELDTELNKRRFMDAAIRKLVQDFIDQGRLNSQSEETSVEAYVSQEIGTDNRETQVVQSWTCLKEMVEIWESYCGTMDDYARQYSRALVNLCNVDIRPSELIPSLLNICRPVQ